MYSYTIRTHHLYNMVNTGIVITSVVLIIILILIHNVNCYSKNYNDLEWDKVLATQTQDGNTSGDIKASPIVVFLLCYSYPKVPDYLNYNLQILKKYCSSHNYKLIERNYSEIDISPYWLRVKELLELSKQYPLDTIFIYLDADATINPKHFNVNMTTLVNKLETIAGHPCDIFIGSDPPFFFLTLGYNESTLNTGVMILKNSLWTKSFLRRWYSRYNGKMWKKNGDSWVCTKDSEDKCSWAREGYEQGELNYLYSQNTHDEKNHILNVHYTVLSNNDVNNDSFIIHLMASTNRTRDIEFKRLLDKL